jgi:hypothetical protein
MKTVRLHGLIAALVGGLALAAAAQPAFRTDKAHEDSVRILVLANLDPRGKCDGPTGPVGQKTLDFLLLSLQSLPHVVSREAESTSWEDVAGIWPGRLPHVIVHVNAGWQSESGPHLEAILNAAADSSVGVVSIGDDAASFAEKTFGFRKVDNQPEPMGDARQYDGPEADLWIDLDGSGDSLGTGGIVRNTVLRLGTHRLHYLPVEPDDPDPAGAYRCQADADRYTVEAGFEDKVAFLGYQRAFDGADTVGGPRELQVIAAFQDRARRGVALSYQPQFLADGRAAHQINYDAVIFASFAHTYRHIPIIRDTVPPMVVVDSPAPAPPLGIRRVAAHPPVAGDARLRARTDGSGMPATLRWIPPVGWVEGRPYREPQLPSGLPEVGKDGNGPRDLPDGAALVQVVGWGRYVAQVSIFDHLGNFVRRFTQTFGYRGELDNPARRTPEGLQSYLVWDQRDERGRRAGLGVYLWRIAFTVEGGGRMETVIRMGVLRR